MMYLKDCCAGMGAPLMPYGVISTVVTSMPTTQPPPMVNRMMTRYRMPGSTLGAADYSSIGTGLTVLGGLGLLWLVLKVFGGKRKRR